MSRKHFAAIAASIRLIDSPAHRLSAAMAVVDACAPFNTAFNRDRFLAACGV